MIRAEFVSAKKMLCGYRISGHAGGIAGTDIICAAVSSAAYLTANTVTEILGKQAEIACSDGNLSLTVSVEDAPECAVLFQGLRLHLTELAKQYPKNIYVSNTEV